MIVGSMVIYSIFSLVLSLNFYEDILLLYTVMVYFVHFDNLY